MRPSRLCQITRNSTSRLRYVTRSHEAIHVKVLISTSSALVLRCIHPRQNFKEKTLEDIFYEKDVQQFELAFESQMHFGESPCTPAIKSRGALS
jgi:hypothetical protein